MEARRKLMEANEAFNQTMFEANQSFNRQNQAAEFLLAAVSAAEAFAAGNGPRPSLILNEGQMAATEQPQAIEGVSEVTPPDKPEEMPRLLRNRPLEEPIPDKSTEEAWPWAAEIERKIVAGR